MGPHPAVAAIRLAVRRVLHDILTEQTASHVELPRPELQTAHAQTPHAAQVPHSAHTQQVPPGRRTAQLSGQASLGVPTPSRGRRTAAQVPHALQAHHERPPTPLVLVACSGGADSMALASALAFEAPKLGVRAGGVTVDHGLQPGSDLRADEVAQRLRELGLDPVE
ncbi:ATP-binding protein, partial [Streptomyces carpinensis]